MNPKSAGLSAGCKNISKNKGYRHPRAVTLDALDAIVPGQGGTTRTLDSGKTEKDKWTTTAIHKGVYATPADGTFLMLADGTTIREQTQQVAGAMAELMADEWEAAWRIAGKPAHYRLPKPQIALLDSLDSTCLEAQPAWL